MKKYSKVRIGDTFTRLTVVADDGERNSSGARLLLCACECGQKVRIRAAQLTCEKTKSCGCLQEEHRKAGFNRTHGDTDSPEYVAWSGMRQRCNYPKHNRWQHYGGRGIRVCGRWMNSFENFLFDMGRKPTPEHSIDRIDVNGNYELENCRWATTIQQRSNRSDSVARINGAA